MEYYGNLEFQIEKILKSRNISKNKVCSDLGIPRTNFNRYCRNEFQRIDKALICKLCWYFHIGIDELIHYNKSDY